MESLKSFEPGFDFLAKTFAGLEEVLAAELKELGAKDVEIIKRGATFRGDDELMYKINYRSRTAIRILKPIGVFSAKSNDELYQKVRKIDWTKIFNIDQTFIVNTNVFYSEVDHSHFAALRVKDAIVDQFREKEGKRPWVAKDIPDIYVDAHIAHDICTISLDSSGESLHKREYKIATDKAPINEVLAAGMIKLSGWDGVEDFIDPMCGSGTIPMEAAMIAMKIPPGYYRSYYAFSSWSSFNKEIWDKVKAEADAEVCETDCTIIASDRSETACNITKKNLKHAGLHKDVTVLHKYFDELKLEMTSGKLIFNPPYGKRLEERGELRELYSGIGDVLKRNFVGFNAWIITPNIEAAKFVGLRHSEKHSLYNGPIETSYLKFEMYEGTKKNRGDRDDRGERGNRGERASFGDRKREGGYGDKKREGGFGDRKREDDRGSYGDRKREGGYGDRKREGGYGDRRRDSNSGDKDRDGGYKERRREAGFKDASNDGGGYYERQRDNHSSERKKSDSSKPDYSKKKFRDKKDDGTPERRAKRPRKPKD